MVAPELTARLEAQHRRRMRAEVEAAFRQAGVVASFLSDPRQLELLTLLRSWPLDQEKGPVVDVQTALQTAAGFATSDLVVVMADNPLRQPAVLVPAKPLFTALSRDPFFADRNGLLLLDPDGSGALFIDYHAAEPTADTQVTPYGAWRRKGSE